MGLRGGGALAIWNAVTAEAEEEFYRWHNTEHIPERVAVPGFLRGRRYVNVARARDFFTLYETQSADILKSAPYLARLNDPTPWTRRVLPHFRDTVRIGCRVAGSWGRGQGGALLALRLPPRGMRQEQVRSWAEAELALVRQLAGVIGVHVLEPAPETTRIPTREKELRAQPATAAGAEEPWVLLVEVNDPEVADAVLRGPLAPVAVRPETFAGVYRLQISLDRA